MAYTKSSYELTYVIMKMNAITPFTAIVSMIILGTALLASSVSSAIGRYDDTKVIDQRRCNNLYRPSRGWVLYLFTTVTVYQQHGRSIAACTSKANATSEHCYYCNGSWTNRRSCRLAVSCYRNLAFYGESLRPMAAECASW